MEVWVINSSYGILGREGWFETEDECEEKCKQLQKSMELVNVYFLPLKLEKNK